MRFRHVEQRGLYFRVADPQWQDPLDGSHSATAGGRWNAPGSFAVVYLCGTRDVARGIVLRRFEDDPYGALDIPPEQRPRLVETDVPRSQFVDVVTDAGCRAAGLPSTYPRDAGGVEVGWDRCRPIGQAAWDQDEPGIACRSAAAMPQDRCEELAWFDRGDPLTALGRRSFDEWFG